eukprot:876046-Pleurochrysis_carterae.AAC.1
MALLCDAGLPTQCYAEYRIMSILCNRRRPISRSARCPRGSAIRSKSSLGRTTGSASHAGTCASVRFCTRTHAHAHAHAHVDVDVHAYARASRTSTCACAHTRTHA